MKESYVETVYTAFYGDPSRDVFLHLSPKCSGAGHRGILQPGAGLDFQERAHTKAVRKTGKANGNCFRGIRCRQYYRRSSSARGNGIS